MNTKNTTDATNADANVTDELFTRENVKTQRMDVPIAELRWDSETFSFRDNVKLTEAAIKTLADSIREAGVLLVPLLVKQIDGGYDRAEVITIAVDQAKERYGQRSWDSIVYVGDGSWDLRAAKTIGVGFVGIASHHKAEALVNSGAKHVLADFAATSHFFNAIESASMDDGKQQAESSGKE